MIIPVRCMTCGKVVGDKWRHYEREVRRLKEARGISLEHNTYYQGADMVTSGKTPECEVLDNLGLERYCCRRMLLSHIDL